MVQIQSSPSFIFTSETYICNPSHSPSQSKIKKVLLGGIRALKEHFGKKIGHTILKSKLEDTKENITAKKQHLQESGHGSLLQIKSANKRIVLDCFILYPTSESNKYIVVFNGMGSLYENHLDSLKKLAKDTNAHVLTFNYRGVGDSQILNKKEQKGKAKSSKDLIQDGEMVLEYLQSKGIDPKNIMLYGHSMGGGVAAEIHAKVEHKGPLLSESSFSSFGTAIKAKKGKLSALLVRLFGWNLNPMNAFKNPKNKAIITNKRDPIVIYEKASLYRKVKAKLKKGDEILRLKLGKYPTEEIKFGARKESKTKTKSAKKKEIHPDHRNYKKALRKIKKKKLIHQILNPHQRVMDRLFKGQYKLPSIEEKNVCKLRNEMLAEDLIAYEKVLGLIECLWSSV